MKQGRSWGESKCAFIRELQASSQELTSVQAFALNERWRRT